MKKHIEIIDESSIRKIWPYNLSFKVTDSLEKAMAISVPIFIKCVDEDLTKRESEILHLYYENGTTLDVCAETYSVTRERIRQIMGNAIRKLNRSKVRTKYSLYSCTELDTLRQENKRLKEKLYSIENDECFRMYQSGKEWQDYISEKDRNAILYLPIDYLDLTVREYNGLCRYLFKSCGRKPDNIEDLTSLSFSEVKGIKNIGIKSIEHILHQLSLYGLGLRDMDWNTYQNLKGEKE